MHSLHSRVALVIAGRRLVNVGYRWFGDFGFLFMLKSAIRN